jgi:hypothetical protein
MGKRGRKDEGLGQTAGGMTGRRTTRRAEGEGTVGLGAFGIALALEADDRVLPKRLFS